MSCIFHFAAAALVAVTISAYAGNRAGGPYTVNDTVDAAGGRSRSANNLFTNDASVGGISGISAVASPAPGRTAKHGYVGQLHDIVGLVLNAMPASVNEGQTRQLSASNLLDDATLIAVAPESVTWSVLSGPITSVSTGGLATAAIVYQNTNGNVQGSRGSFSSTLLLTVLNVGNDDFGIYAADGVDDDWQVQYFGENSPNGLAAADPDRDGQNNRFEFTAGLIPNNATSRFLLRVGAVPGQPNQRQIVFSPRLAGRTYTPQFRTSLAPGSWAPLTGTTQIDNGAERIVTDLNATGVSKFYRVQITRP